MELIIHTDGGSRGNPGPAASSFIVSDSGSRIIAQRGVYIGIATNNQAEYLAVSNALLWLNQYLNTGVRAPIRRITFFLDSELAVNQLNGKYKIKSQSLSHIIRQINIVKQKIPIPVSFQHITRDKNKNADKLVNQTLDSLLK